MYKHVCIQLRVHMCTHTCTYNIYFITCQYSFIPPCGSTRDVCGVEGMFLLQFVTRTTLNPVVTRVCVCHHT